MGFSFNYVMNKGIWLQRVEAFCQFNRPAKFNDLLEVELAIEELKEKSIKYGFKIFNEDSAALLANGYVVIVAADKQTGKATQIPKDYCGKAEDFLRIEFIREFNL